MEFVARAQVLGFNLGVADGSPLAYIGATVCASTTWTSTTSFTCNQRPGLGNSIATSYYVASASGTFAAAFSFDAPVASFAFPSNSPLSGGVRITYHGLNFAQDRPLSETIGMQQCWDLQWTVGPTDPAQADLMPVLLCRNFVDSGVLGYRSGLPAPSDPYSSLQALTVSTQVSRPSRVLYQPQAPAELG